MSIRFPRVAILWDGSEIPCVVTDCSSLRVFSVDGRAPSDRVFEHEAGRAFLRIMSIDELDKLLDGPVGKIGDRPIVEQAVRAMLDLGSDGRPRLSVVKEPE